MVKAEAREAAAAERAAAAEAKAAAKAKAAADAKAAVEAKAAKEKAEKEAALMKINNEMASKLQAAHRGKSTRKKLAEAKELASRAADAQELAPPQQQRGNARMSVATNELSLMAEALEGMIKERDEIAQQLQATPDGIDPEAALQIAVRLVTRHGELEGEIEQLEFAITQKTDDLAGILDAAEAAGGPAAANQENNGSAGNGGLPPLPPRRTSTSFSERKSRISRAPKLATANGVTAESSTVAAPKAAENPEDCRLQ